MAITRHVLREFRAKPVPFGSILFKAFRINDLLTDDGPPRWVFGGFVTVSSGNGLPRQHSAAATNATYGVIGR
ncbi:hypothetical protein EVS84_00880 [Pseudomonas koreensis]|uniref:Uncharacterized protein n=2 Tax=Pseudomonas TaxID=286 RepID=A0A4Q4L8Z9_9PSED|nr:MULTISPECIES: hypothetical protein [Pseudomonas]WKV82861.1 hypothetical protein LJJ44_15885 [Pseudomonas sp. B24_DOA]WKV88440.1 hypothetical protein LJU32_23940 [Pseudomonas sp. B21_DOA]MDM8190669.1 hypothetical protein [Pseudomonas fluorescens]MDP8571914.1 hypothetical protein [Pseudomonas iranensis]MDR7054596.1 hypothetical protein [Pseudomonas koreensis]